MHNAHIDAKLEARGYIYSVNELRTDCRTDSASLNSCCARLEEEVTSLKYIVSGLSTQIHRQETRNKKYKLSISGLHENRSENCPLLVVNIFKALDLEVTTSEIEHASHIHSTNANHDKPKPILVVMESISKRN